MFFKLTAIVTLLCLLTAGWIYDHWIWPSSTAGRIAAEDDAITRRAEALLKQNGHMTINDLELQGVVFFCMCAHYASCTEEMYPQAYASKYHVPAYFKPGSIGHRIFVFRSGQINSIDFGSGPPYVGLDHEQYCSSNLAGLIPRNPDITAVPQALRIQTSPVYTPTR